MFTVSYSTDIGFGGVVVFDRNKSFLLLTWVPCDSQVMHWLSWRSESNVQYPNVLQRQAAVLSTLLKCHFADGWVIWCCVSPAVVCLCASPVTGAFARFIQWCRKCHVRTMRRTLLIRSTIRFKGNNMCTCFFASRHQNHNYYNCSCSWQDFKHFYSSNWRCISLI